MKARLAILVAAVALFGFIIRSSPMSPVTEPRGPLTLSLTLPQSVSTFLEAHADTALAEDMLDSEKRDDGVIIPVARAADVHENDPSEIVLDYAHPTCPIALPAGRQAEISFLASVLVGAYLILPLEPMDWEGMPDMVDRLRETFAAADWRYQWGDLMGPEMPDGAPVTVQRFNEKTYGTRVVQVGRWIPCDSAPVSARVEIRHLGSGPTGASIPPSAVGAPRDPEAPDMFVARVVFDVPDTVADGARQLVRARRLAVTGDPDAPLPLSVWRDDPTWRPQGWAGTLVP